MCSDEADYPLPRATTGREVTLCPQRTHSHPGTWAHRPAFPFPSGPLTGAPTTPPTLSLGLGWVPTSAGSGHYPAPTLSLCGVPTFLAP